MKKLPPPAPPDLVNSDFPDYHKMVTQVIARMGGSIEDYAGFRLKLRYPPIPTLLAFRHRLLATD